MDLTITYEFADPTATVDPAGLEAALADLADLLADRAAVTTGLAPAVPGGRWGITVTTTCDPNDPHGTSVAITGTLGEVLERAAKVDLPAWPLARVEALTEPELDRLLAEPDPRAPDLVGVAEIGAMLGVTRQRASQIQTLHDFPTPLARLKAGPVWRRHDIAVWAETWDRKSGRPRKDPK